MNKLLLLITITVLASCGAQIKTTKTNSPVIKYSSDVCFGNCKQESLVIYPNFKMDYVGVKNVDNIGKFRATISQEDYDNLQRTFATAKFTKMDDTYLSDARDIQKMRISQGNKTVTFNKRNATDDLQKVYSQITKIIEKYDWSK